MGGGWQAWAFCGWGSSRQIIEGIVVVWHARSCQMEDAGTSMSERRSESLLDVISLSPYQTVPAGQLT